MGINTIEDLVAAEDEAFEIQTRSHEGEIRYFKKFREALDFSKTTHEKARISSPNEHDQVVWKISFSLHSGERVRLILDESDGWNWHWILEQMEDEVAEELTARAGSHTCVLCGDPAIMWTPGGHCCAKCSDDGTSGATC